MLVRLYQADGDRVDGDGVASQIEDGETDQPLGEAPGSDEGRDFQGEAQDDGFGLLAIGLPMLDRVDIPRGRGCRWWEDRLVIDIEITVVC